MPTRSLPLITVLVLAIACGTPSPTAPDPAFQIQPPTQLPCLTCSPTIRTFSKPFVGSFPAIELFDHNAPRQFTDANGTATFFWGETVPIRSVGGVPVLIDGHNGYDWKLPLATQVRAVAAGRVIGRLNGNPNATCPFAAPALTQQRRITLEHRVQDTIVIRTVYDHLSQLQVALGDSVSEGQVIGLSGQTGCARGPHLHFNVLRVTRTNNGNPTVIDPFGWQDRNATDPWRTAADGAESIFLWKTNEVPPRSLTVFQTVASGFNSAITSVSWIGERDTQSPNNEELVLTFFGSAGQVFSVARIKGDRSGLDHAFSPQPTINTARPRLHIFTGTGINNDTTIYLGRNAPVWDNGFNDCARIEFAQGGRLAMNLGNGCP